MLGKKAKKNGKKSDLEYVNTARCTKRKKKRNNLRKKKKGYNNFE